MKFFFQILFLFLTWFTNIVNATPVFAKVVLPICEFIFSNTENVKEESVVKIGVQNFARSCISENSFSQKAILQDSYALVGASRTGVRKVVSGAGNFLDNIYNAQKSIINTWKNNIATATNIRKGNFGEIASDAFLAEKNFLAFNPSYS